MVSSMFQIRLKVAANLSIIYYLIFTNLIRYYMVTYQVNDPKKRYTGENSLKSEEIQYSKVFVSAMEECYFYHYKYNIRSENKLFFLVHIRMIYRLHCPFHSLFFVVLGGKMKIVSYLWNNN